MLLLHASLNSSKEFRIRRETTHPAVVQSLVYFVRSDFEQKYGRDLYKVKRQPHRDLVGDCAAFSSLTDGGWLID